MAAKAKKLIQATKILQALISTALLAFRLTSWVIRQNPYRDSVHLINLAGFSTKWQLFSFPVKKQ
jgi:hypothetical protein